jgi:hypothetical protein
VTTHGDPLAALQAAGFPLDLISDEELAVFRTLSAAEVSLLVGIKERLDAAAPEVQAHVTVAGAGLF